MARCVGSSLEGSELIGVFIIIIIIIIMGGMRGTLVCNNSFLPKMGECVAHLTLKAKTNVFVRVVTFA
jgi:hypothetical protein